MSADDKERIEQIAAEQDLAHPDYRGDLNPEYPKFEARCECGWAASDFGEDVRGQIVSIGQSHEQRARHDICDVTVRRHNADESSEVIR